MSPVGGMQPGHPMVFLSFKEQLKRNRGKDEEHSPTLGPSI